MERVLDIYLFCTDGLCGMMQAIQAVYPKSRLQRCIVHQIRSSTKYVSYKDIKTVVTDLKKVYTAVTLEEAGENLRHFSEVWRKQYPSCVRSWEDNWEILSTFFEYPPEIRKIIYTTNIIEGLNRQFRQITKNKPSFTNDDSLRRMLYLASQRIVKHWHGPKLGFGAQPAANFVRRSNGGLTPLSLEFPGEWNGIHAVPARIPFHPPEDGSGQGV